MNVPRTFGASNPAQPFDNHFSICHFIGRVVFQLNEHRHEQHVRQKGAVKGGQQCHSHRRADRLGVTHITKHQDQPDQRTDHPHSRSDINPSFHAALFGLVTGLHRLNLHGQLAHKFALISTVHQHLQTLFKELVGHGLTFKRHHPIFTGNGREFDHTLDENVHLLDGGKERLSHRAKTTQEGWQWCGVHHREERAADDDVNGGHVNEWAQGAAAREQRAKNHSDCAQQTDNRGQIHDTSSFGFVS